MRLLLAYTAEERYAIFACRAMALPTWWRRAPFQFGEEEATGALLTHRRAGGRVVRFLIRLRPQEPLQISHGRRRDPYGSTGSEAAYDFPWR